MINTLKKLFGSRAKADFNQMVQNGAQIIDVRTAAEYKQGHIKGSVNIPLDSLSGQARLIKKDKPVITCCASGMRSAQACNQLRSMGFHQVSNGGGWLSLQKKIEMI